MVAHTAGASARAAKRAATPAMKSVVAASSASDVEAPIISCSPPDKRPPPASLASRAFSSNGKHSPIAAAVATRPKLARRAAMCFERSGWACMGLRFLLFPLCSSTSRLPSILVSSSPKLRHVPLSSRMLASDFAETASCLFDLAKRSCDETPGENSMIIDADNHGIRQASYMPCRLGRPRREAYERRRRASCSVTAR